MRAAWSPERAVPSGPRHRSAVQVREVRVGAAIGDVKAMLLQACAKSHTVLDHLVLHLAEGLGFAPA